MTLIVNCKRSAYDIYIGRPSRFGNPFSHKTTTMAKFRVFSRDEAILKYEEWITTQHDLLDQLETLRGKVLGCWCRPERCHGDVILKLLGEAPGVEA